MTEKEDVRKFDKWVGEWDRNNGKGLLSHPRLVNAFLAGLKAGREEWHTVMEGFYDSWEMFGWFETRYGSEPKEFTRYVFKKGGGK